MADKKVADLAEKKGGRWDNSTAALLVELMVELLASMTADMMAGR